MATVKAVKLLLPFSTLSSTNRFRLLMLFPTIEFAIFFLIVFPINWWLSRFNIGKKTFLLAASYVFYSFWNWHFVLLLIGSSLGNFGAGLLIAGAGSAAVRHRLCGLAVLLNLVPLGFFKYFDFGRAQVETFLSLFGFAPDFGSSSYPVPVAISFLTFHAISYVVDVNRGRTAASRSPIDLMLYIRLFPTSRGRPHRSCGRLPRATRPSVRSPDHRARSQPASNSRRPVLRRS